MMRLLGTITAAALIAPAALGATAEGGGQAWTRLPDAPQALSGRFAGVSNGALILAGGSYFTKSLYEGGEKRFSDRVDVLESATGAWRDGGGVRLPAALAQGASVTTPDGVVCLGGADAVRASRDAFRLRWIGGRVVRDPIPDLPAPATFLGAAAIGRVVYAAGGASSPAATEAAAAFWRLDLAAPKPRWEVLPPWPGPGRIGPVVAALNGDVYVVSGAALRRDGGKPARTYLSDAYRYRPSAGTWQRIADVPGGAAVAAPAAASGGRLLVFGGDDGILAPRQWELRDAHPGFRRDVLAYDPAADRWTSTGPILPFSLVTNPAAVWQDRIVVPGGEDRPGHRSPAVLATPALSQTAVAPPSGVSSIVAPSVLNTAYPQTPLFVEKTGGYKVYRIPSLIVTKKGTVLAFCEARNGTGDTGNIDLVVRRSADGGRTWGPMQTVWDDGDNTCGNPCPVIDENTGDVVLLMTHNLGVDKESEIELGTSQGTRTAWVCESRDDGLTWTKPREITKDVKKPNWTWYATGPGVAIQLRSGAHKGRLVVPCNHATAGERVSCSHVIYSDDHGKTWTLGGDAHVGTNESQVAELSDGRLMLNMRSSVKAEKKRGVAYSSDGGATWTDFHFDPNLPEPHCQGSILSVPRGGAGRKPLLLFSNPASPETRDHLTIRASDDDGATWRTVASLHDGPAAYSSLTVLPDGAVGCLYEGGVGRPYESILFARVPLGEASAVAEH